MPAAMQQQRTYRRAAMQQLALFDACLLRLAARETRASELEQQLLRATACVDSMPQLSSDERNTLYGTVRC
jgi:hypothetical protein